MCGFAGFLLRQPTETAEALQQTVTRMADTLQHRGPNDSGVWLDVAAGIALGFRRLAIVDLTPEGHQPMVSASGRYVLVFNGEIYNHAALREELPAFHYRGHSDTETMLAAFEHWGIDESLHRFAGMFAFALWDRQTRTLTLARDRLGEKPLYYGWCGDVFLFGSELKALRQHPRCNTTIRRDILPTYLQHGCIPAPYTIYQHLAKLPPATQLSFTLERTDTRPGPYWQLHDAFTLAREYQPTTLSQWTEELERVLRTCIGEQMVADVPLGAFLSGGVDSSTIVALMQAQSSRPVRTFTIGFHESGFNEAEHAKAVAKHLGTDHTELYVTPAEALAVIPHLPTLYDEPFADSSQIPTFLVAQMAARHVTVSLSGDGGDEVFAGYRWYPRSLQLWWCLRLLPRALRQLLAGVLPSARGPRRLHKLRQCLLQANSLEELHLWLLSTHWPQAVAIAPSTPEPRSNLNEAASAGWQHPLERLQTFDMRTYLPDDILVKVDRAAMGVSLETRAPFLDHRVVEFACTIPPRFKLHGQTGKWLLRQVLYKHVPRALIERPKQGFSVPVAAWLRGSLRDWAEALLDEAKLRQQGFFSAAAVRQLWHEHLAGTHDWQAQLWHLLMFQAWLERWTR